MIWDIVNALGRFVIVTMVIWELVKFPHMLTSTERAGMSLMGGAALMTIPVIFALPARSPFSDWASTVMTYGIVIYLFGRMTRLRRHDRANQRQIAKYQPRDRPSKG
jgi:hypothetical protein